MLSNILNIYCKNIFNNFLIAESCRTRTHLFPKLLSPAPAPAPESRNAPVLHSKIEMVSYFVKLKNSKCKKYKNKNKKINKKRKKERKKERKKKSLNFPLLSQFLT